MSGMDRPRQRSMRKISLRYNCLTRCLSLRYLMSLFLYILRVRFGSRVRLKPRGKQVPVAPQSLKANVDKPQLKYKAVFDTKMSHGSRRLTETWPKGLEKGHNGNNPNLSARK